MKKIVIALAAFSALAATSTLAQAQDYGHHWHHRHGPVIVVGPNHHSHDWGRDHWRRDYHPHHRYPAHHHDYHN